MLKKDEVTERYEHFLILIPIITLSVFTHNFLVKFYILCLIIEIYLKTQEKTLIIFLPLFDS